MTVKTPQCIPTWLEPRGGVLLVVGSAKCVYEDVRRARQLRPDAHVLAINEAGGAIADIEHLLAGHCEKAGQYLAYRRRKFPNAKSCFVHASYRDGRMMPGSVTHCWRHVATGGTSAWKAVRIGKAMGYEEIILCGCPMDNSGYFFAEEQTGIVVDCDRIGLGEGRMYDNYRRTFAKRAQEEGQNVYSMSGYSRELLGEPPAIARAA